MVRAEVLQGVQQMRFEGLMERHERGELSQEEAAEMLGSRSVVSREFSEELGGRLVIEASQACAIVIGDEGKEVGVANGMVEKAAVVGGQ